MKRFALFFVLALALVLSTCEVCPAQVVGTYYADWSLSPVSYGPTHIAPGQFPALSSLNLVVEFGDGNVVATAPYYTVIGGGADSTKYRYSDYYNPDGRWVPWQDSLARTVHRSGGKLLITIQAVDPTALKTIQADSTKTDAFCFNAAQYAKRRGLDGLEVDEEYWQSAAPSNATLATFYRILRRRVDEAFLPARGIIVLTTGRSSMSNYSNVNKSDVDYVFFMLYDYQWVWSTSLNAAVSYYFSPLDTPAGGTNTNAASIVSDGPASWASAGWPKAKCVFGIPAYGFVFRGANALWQTYGASSNASEIISSSLPTALANGGTQGWDAVAQEPYIGGTASKAFSLKSTSGGTVAVSSGQKFFISFENQASLQAKYNYIRAQGFGGIFLYDVGGDVDATMPGGTYTPLHTVLASIVTVPVAVPTGTFTYTGKQLAVGGPVDVKLSWTSKDAVGATISPGVGVVTLSGTKAVRIYTSTIFSLTLTGPGGKAVYSVTVKISPKPSPVNPTEKEKD